jgi:hypothetical protein
MDKLKEPRYLKGGALIASFLGLVGLGFINVDKTYNPIEKKTEVAHIRPKRIPKILGLTQIVGQIELENLGWGLDTLGNGDGINAYKVLPNGQQVEISLTADGSHYVGNNMPVNPEESGILDITVFPKNLDHMDETNKQKSDIHLILDYAFNPINHKEHGDYEAIDIYKYNKSQYYDVISSSQNGSIEYSFGTFGSAGSMNDIIIVRGAKSTNSADQLISRMEGEVLQIANAVQNDANLPNLEAIRYPT